MSITLGQAHETELTGWECVEPVEVEEGEFEPFLQDFLREGERRIGGEEMIKRAENKTGLRHAEAMLRNQEKIPVEWRKYYLVFPEVWQNSRGYRYAWFLCWLGERWYLYSYWLDYDFGSDYRLVASRKYQKSLGI